MSVTHCTRALRSRLTYWQFNAKSGTIRAYLASPHVNPPRREAPFVRYGVNKAPTRRWWYRSRSICGAAHVACFPEPHGEPIAPAPNGGAPTGLWPQSALWHDCGPLL